MDPNNNRVHANAIELFGELGKTSLLQAELKKFSSNRAVANAAIALGTREISDDVLVVLIRMLRSGDEGKIASAMYAVKRIFTEHHRKNPAFVKTASFFSDLYADLKLLDDHRLTVNTCARKANIEQIYDALSFQTQTVKTA